MSIKYNPNKKSVFDNDIANSVKNLRSAAKAIYNVWTSKYPQTVIGKKFNNARVISRIEVDTENLSKQLLAVKYAVENQIALYKAQLKEVTRLLLSMQGLPCDNLNNLSYEELKELFLKTRS